MRCMSVLTVTLILGTLATFLTVAGVVPKSSRCQNSRFDIGGGTSNVCSFGFSICFKCFCL